MFNMRAGIAGKMLIACVVFGLLLLLGKHKLCIINNARSSQHN
jgi:hypothetical protein